LDHVQQQIARRPVLGGLTNECRRRVNPQLKPRLEILESAGEESAPAESPVRRGRSISDKPFWKHSVLGMNTRGWEISPIPEAAKFSFGAETSASVAVAVP
jgi:hypothetical protein